jgi:hypothetical protein
MHPRLDTIPIIIVHKRTTHQRQLIGVLKIFFIRHIHQLMGLNEDLGGLLALMRARGLGKVVVLVDGGVGFD